MPEDYIRVCHFDSVDDLKRSLINTGIVKTNRRLDDVESIPEIIYSALNADADRTKILGCRTHESVHTKGKQRGIRSMSVNDVIAMTIDGVRRCFIVRDEGFGELPAGWETAPLDMTKPLPYGIVGQCQDVSDNDRGDVAWQRFVYGTITKDWPNELMQHRTDHGKPYSDHEVNVVTKWVLDQVTSTNNACIDDETKKYIREYIRNQAR